jgi:hypothetical protein
MKLTKLVMILMLLSVVSFAQTVAPPTNLKAALVGPNHTTFQAVGLTWEYTQVMNRVTYNIYKRVGTLSDTTPFMRIGQTEMRSFMDPVQEGKTFSYYVTALINHVESDASNKVEITVVPPVVDYGKISGNLFDDSSKTGIRGNISFIPATDSMHMMDNYGISVMADSNGNFSAKLKAGTYIIFASSRGYFGEFYNNVQDIKNATKVTLNLNDSLYFSIGLAKLIPPVTYTVSGWVKDGAGNPQKAALNAFITNKQHTPSCWDMTYAARTDSFGNYQIKGVRPGDTLVIFAQPFDRAFQPQYYNGKTTFGTADRIGVTGDVTNINFTLVAKPVYANGISGTVKDSAGTTIVSGSVFAFRKGAMINDRFGFKIRVQVDTLTGAYSFTNLEPGQYILLAEGRGYAPSFFKYDGSTTMDPRKADSVVVTETSLVTGINFFLKVRAPHVGGGFAFGIVKGNDGSTLPGTLNYLVDASGNFVNYSVTDLDGSYMIQNIEAGNYTLVSALPSFQSAQKSLSVDYLNNSTLNVDVNLTPNSTTGITDNATVITGYALMQNYPNPFNPSTTISYQLPQNSFVTLKVYNILGNEVATLVNEQQTAGKYNFNFKANNLASGVYFYKLTAGNFTSIKKLTLLK